MKTPTARRMVIGLTLAATALAGTAYAEQTARAGRDPDRVITRAEVQSHSAEMFAKLDVNKDGKLDKADREAKRNAMFDRIDTDHNGQLSRAEFGSRPQFDHDGMHRGGPNGDGPDGHDGKGPHGPDGGMHHGGRGHGRGPGGMMMGAMADANKDGAITQAEFTAAALQRFDGMDADKDGKVTPAERQAARAAMRAQWQARHAEAAPAAPAS